MTTRRTYSDAIRLTGTFLFTLLLTIAATRADAAIRTWDGSSSVFWNDAANWEEGIVPVDGDFLIFEAGAANTTNQNDIPGLEPEALYFNASYHISGNPITTVTGLVVGVTDAIVTIDLAITTTAFPQSWVVGQRGTLIRNGTLTLGGLVTFDAGSVDSLIHGTGTIAGTGGFQKTGEGELRLSVASTFTGSTLIHNGTVRASHASALGAGDGTLATGTRIQAGGRLILEPASLANERLVVGTLSTLQVNTSSSLTGPIEVENQGMIQIAEGQSLVALGPVSSEDGIVRVGGAGTLVLAGTPNPIATLQIGSPAPSTATVRLDTDSGLTAYSTANIAAGATLDLDNRRLDLRTLVGAGQLVLGVAGPPTPGQLALHPVADHVFDGVISGPGFLTVDGSARIAFTADQQIDGAVDIGAGTLSLRNSNLLSPITVHGSGILSLVDTTQVGDLTLEDGRLDLTERGLLEQVGANAFEMTGAARMDILAEAVTGCTKFTVAGSVSLAGGLTVGFASGPPTLPPTNFTCTVIDNLGTDPIAGTFDNLPEGARIDVGGTGQQLAISYVGGDGNDVTLSTPERSYYLSEGAIGSFFDLDILIANPNTTAVDVVVTFLTDGAGTHELPLLLQPTSRTTINVETIAQLQGANAISTIVTSLDGSPVIVERTMRWDATGYGAHTEKATNGTATTWYFAEGSQGFFQTYLLLANPHPQAVKATVDYLIEDAPSVTRTYDVAPNARFTVDAGAEGLTGSSFGMIVTFDRPAVAERAMYFSQTGRLFEGGHESAGATAPATSWFLAEGATGPFFETYVLLANPNDTPTAATVRFLPDTGQAVTKSKTVPARGRLTINIEGEDASLTNAAVATEVTSTLPIIVERAQYWPDPAPSWFEAHNSFGLTELGMRWGLAEGRVGGPEEYQTYILLANPAPVTATVSIQFLRTSGQPFTRTFLVPPAARFNVSTGPGLLVPDLNDESFGAVITSDAAIAVERAMYSNSNGQVWAAGTNATATRLP